MMCAERLVLDESAIASPSHPARVLVVEDSHVVRRLLERALTEKGYLVEAVDDALVALRRLTLQPFDLVVSDIKLPGLDGIGLLRRIRELGESVPVVLVTGAPSLDSAVSGIEHGAVAYLRKPFSMDELCNVVRRGVHLGRRVRLARRMLDAAHLGAEELDELEDLDAALTEAIESLWIAFQPIVEASTGATFGYEALMRSEHDGLPHPGAVLAAAEQLDRTAELGRHLRRKTVAAYDAGEPDDDCLLFVNLHPRDLLDDELYSVESPLSARARSVVLEVTERATLTRIDDLDERLAQLRRMGYRLAVDDLGSGYSGLTSLATLQPEFVKLDMSLVRDVDTNGVRERVIEATARLAASLGCKTVAEGIETPGEYTKLTALGCDLLQGYAIARPGPAFPDTSTLVEISSGKVPRERSPGRAA